ncbi:AraC family transcriptional regulator [Nonomuraea sp. B10E15]|uniref:helix-turn-helix transcriptional regulator n=1 Tax=Nonomuraea sp. B10E15 TaxID=3153560 RepID=UPI00325CBE89
MDGLPGVGPHSHEFIEIVVVESGQARHETQLASRTVGRGYCAVLRPGHWHSWRDCRALRVWNIYLGTESLHSALRWLRDSPECSSLIRPPAPGRVVERQLDDPTLVDVTRWLREVPPRDAPGSITYASRRVGLLTAVLGALSTASGPDGPALHQQQPAQLPAAITDTLRLLECDVARQWTLGDLVEASHLSASHLSRLFLQATGMSPIAYLARLRAEHVAADLINSDDPISEIGRRYGWPDPNYLSRRFRQVFGISPRDFRRRYGGAVHS